MNVGKDYLQFHVNFVFHRRAREREGIMKSTIITKKCEGEIMRWKDYCIIGIFLAYVFMT
jgi:hypothetical protein